MKRNYEEDLNCFNHMTKKKEHFSFIEFQFQMVIYGFYRS